MSKNISKKLPRPSEMPDIFRNEVKRLNWADFSLLPLGGGEDGKKPLAKSWAGPAMKLGQVLGPMHRTGSTVYGIRLGGLTVIDCDIHDDDLVRELERRFGSAAVHVKTPRGLHMYYRAGDYAPNLRGEGIPVDVKSGSNSYVVGPYSVRKDGGKYTPVKGILGQTRLTFLDCPQNQRTSPAKIQKLATQNVPEGERHSTLRSAAARIVALVDTQDELFASLIKFRDENFDKPQSFPDGEVLSIATWAWETRLKGRIFNGRQSSFRIDRIALDALKGKPNGSDATSLYVTLVDAHGHQPGKKFSLDFNAMRAAGVTDLTVPRLRKARQMLIDNGLLRLVGKHFAGSQRQTFSLIKLNLGVADAENVTHLTPVPALDAGAEKRKREG